MRERNLPLPDWAVDAPEVPEAMFWYIQAYWQLDSCRAWAEHTPKAIPWTAILQYAEYHNADFDVLLPIIHAMDSEYISYSVNQMKKEMKEQERKAKNTKGSKTKYRPRRR